MVQRMNFFLGQKGFPNGFGWFSFCVFALRKWYGENIKLPDNITVQELIWCFFTKFLFKTLPNNSKGMNLDNGTLISNSKNHAIHMVCLLFS